MLQVSIYSIAFSAKAGPLTDVCVAQIATQMMQEFYMCKCPQSVVNTITASKVASRHVELEASLSRAWSLHWNAVRVISFDELSSPDQNWLPKGAAIVSLYPVHQWLHQNARWHAQGMALSFVAEPTVWSFTTALALTLVHSIWTRASHGKAEGQWVLQPKCQVTWPIRGSPTHCTDILYL